MVAQDLGRYRKLEQRRIRMLQPWREEFLYLGLDGRIHGRFVPPWGAGFRAEFRVTAAVGAPECGVLLTGRM